MPKERWSGLITHLSRCMTGNRKENVEEGRGSRENLWNKGSGRAVKLDS